MLATLAFIGVGVAIALMVMPDNGGATSAVAATPTATPGQAAAKKKARPKKKPAKPKGPTKAQRAARKAAVAERAPAGLHDAQAERLRPEGDVAGADRAPGRRRRRAATRAFFFIKDQFLGNDALSPSTKLTVAKTGKITVTLSYGVYAPGDTPGSPSGRKRVRFRLEGAAHPRAGHDPARQRPFQRPKG